MHLPAKPYMLWLALHVLVYFAVATTHEKYVASDANFDDGFAVGVHYIANAIYDGRLLSEILGEQLGGVHLARYLSVYPMHWLWENGYHHISQYALLLGAMWPILTMRYKGYSSVLQPLIIYFPLFVSFRAILVICSVTYLFMVLFLGRQSRLLLFSSAIWANLSSGASIAWILISLINISSLASRYRLAFAICALGLTAGVVSSIDHKRSYFHEISTIDKNRWQMIIYQGTLLESYRNGQYGRLAVYMAILVLGIGIVFRGVTERAIPRRFILFYVVCVFGFLVEGLSAIGFVVPVFWFYLGVRPVDQIPESALPAFPHFGRRSLFTASRMPIPMRRGATSASNRDGF